MKVVVVAKANAPTGVCIGALSMGGKSLRLLRDDGTFIPYAEADPYAVGEIWDVTFTRPAVTPPHVEDVHVTARTRSGNQANLAAFIRGCAPAPWAGGVEALFDGKLHYTGSRRAYIGAGFWLPDEDLTLDDGGNSYEIGGTTINYVGCSPPARKISARTLVRVSLARWWKPEHAADDFPERCYVEVSGCYGW